jgi:hypothetical protein
MVKLRNFQWLKKKDQIAELEKAFKEIWRYYDLALEKAPDFPYWSTEMALVANLAMAAARLEYPAAGKFNQDGSRRKKLEKAGLWVGFSPRRKLLIEVKRDWLSINSDENTIAGNVNWYLNEADEYLKRYLKAFRPDNKPLLPSRCVSLFLAQIYMPHDFPSQYPDCIKEFLQSCEKAVGQRNISFFAYYFVGDLNKIVIKDSADSIRYPGIISFGRISSAESQRKRKQVKYQ